jgi:hypothetical protein
MHDEFAALRRASDQAASPPGPAAFEFIRAGGSFFYPRAKFGSELVHEIW